MNDQFNNPEAKKHREEMSRLNEGISSPQEDWDLYSEIEKLSICNCDYICFGHGVVKREIKKLILSHEQKRNADLKRKIEEMEGYEMNTYDQFDGPYMEIAKDGRYIKKTDLLALIEGK